jgi:hypothetical protein
MHNSSFRNLLLSLVLVAGVQFSFGQEASRSGDGLLVLYDFGLEEGAVVRDLSGQKPPMDLRIANLKAVRRTRGTLEIRGNTTILSSGAASRVIEAVKRSGAISAEAWVQPANTGQDGPARIVTISADTSNRNLTLGQDGNRFDARLRTSRTSNNGLPSTNSPGGSLKAQLLHVVYTRDAGGEARIFLNGKQVAQSKLDGDLGKWNGGYRLGIANEASGQRPWLGTYHLVALYGRALGAEEVLRNFNFGAGAHTEELVAARKKEAASRLFETHVAPILANHCLECHEPANRKGKLDLSTRVAAFAGGSEGKAIVPGKPADSLLWELVGKDEMPKKRTPLKADEKKILREWIEGGAPWTLDKIDPATYVHASAGTTNRLRRLTIPEYVATVKAVTGIDIVTEATKLLPPDLRADGFSNTAYNLNVDLKHVEAFARMAAIVVGRMDIKAFARRFHDKLTLDKQARTLIEKMGRWILRGPLDEREILLYRSITTTAVASGAGFEEAVGSAIEAMLQSPRFLYRLENPQAGGSVDDHEMASRMSYILWGGPPDKELYRAADKGELSDPKKIANQVNRMLVDPRALDQSLRFVYEWLDLGRLDKMQPSRKHFPHWKPKLGVDMRWETLAFARELLWVRKRPLAELLNAQFTFLTPALARHYGIAPRDEALVGYDLSATPGRGGILTQASLLTVGGDEASMVTRGLFVLHELLRGVVRDPPPCVDTTPVPTKPGLSQRGISMERLSSSACKACHSRFEPLAFGLEKFDGLGAFHERDKHGNRLREDGEILFPGTSRPIPFKTSGQLMDLLARSERVGESITWKVTQFALGRPLGAGDVSSVNAIHKAALDGGGTYQALVRAIILSRLVRKY